MASWVTVSQWPMGTLSSTVSDAQALHTLPRVQLVWSRARSTRRSSSPCLVRSRATLAADTKEDVVRQRCHVGCKVDLSGYFESEDCKTRRLVLGAFDEKVQQPQLSPQPRHAGRKGQGRMRLLVLKLPLRVDVWRSPPAARQRLAVCSHLMLVAGDNFSAQSLLLVGERDFLSCV